MKELADSQRDYFRSGKTLPLPNRKKALRRLHEILLKKEKLLLYVFSSNVKKAGKIIRDIPYAGGDGQ